MGFISGLIAGVIIVALVFGVNACGKIDELEEKLLKANTDKMFWRKEALKWANRLGEVRLYTEGLQGTLKEQVERMEDAD